MKLTDKALVFLLIFCAPSMVLGKTFTNCGGNFSAFLTKAEGYATQLGVSSRVLKKTIRRMEKVAYPQRTLSDPPKSNPSSRC